jgi:HEAT repeat protein
MNRTSGVVIAVVGVVALARPLRAQAIADRVSAVRNGMVELHFAARHGVCGDGSERISIGRSLQFGRGDRDAYSSVCEPGPVRVRLRIEDGAVRDIRTSVGPSRPNGTSSTDLGAVPSAAAAAYFLRLARTANAQVSTAAVTAAVLADSAYPWRDLLAVARDSETRSRGTRSNAELWLSRFASEKLNGRENDLSAPDDEVVSDETQARSSAVFALSQLRNHEGIPPLLEVARTNRDAHVRRAALFWLGQSGDGRALDLFEEILKS